MDDTNKDEDVMLDNAEQQIQKPGKFNFVADQRAIGIF